MSFISAHCQYQRVAWWGGARPGDAQRLNGHANRFAVASEQRRTGGTATTGPAGNEPANNLCQEIFTQQWGDGRSIITNMGDIKYTPEQVRTTWAKMDAGYEQLKINSIRTDDTGLSQTTAESKYELRGKSYLVQATQSYASSGTGTNHRVSYKIFQCQDKTHCAANQRTEIFAGVNKINPNASVEAFYVGDPNSDGYPDVGVYLDSGYFVFQQSVKSNE